MYNYAGFNELGYLIVIIEEEFPVIGGTGAGDGFKKRRKTYYTYFDDEYNVDATVVKTEESYCHIIGRVFGKYIITLDVSSIPTKEKYSTLETSATLFGIYEPELTLSAIPIKAKDNTFNVSAILHELFTASFDLNSDSSRKLEFSSDIIGVGLDDKIREYGCYGKLKRTKETSYNIKARKNLESILDLLLMDIKG